MKKNKNEKKKVEQLTKKQRLTKAALISAAVLLAIWIVVAIFLVIVKLGTYEADWDNLGDYDYTGNYDTVVEEDGSIVFVPAKAKAGFVFYTGGMVETEAYIPLMEELASRGVLCIMPDMPLNLAVFDANAAKGLKEKYASDIPDKYWFIGGHSLGGSMAAQYLYNNMEDFYGLVLLAAYSTKDFSTTAFPILSIYGSEDGVLNRDRYEKYHHNIENNFFAEYVIDGGNHSGFAAYGPQKNDGEATITRTEQITLTADAICEFIAFDTVE